MKRLLPFLLLVTACAGSKTGSSGENPASAASPGPATRIPTVALRLASSGGALRAYTLPTLAATGWTIGGRTSPSRAAIGMDVAGRRLLYRASDGAIQSFDLVAYREKPVVPRGEFGTLASDGTLLAVSPQGTVTESQPWGSREWPRGVGRGVRDAFAGLGSRLIVIRRVRGDSLSLASREAGVTLTAPVPDATARGASRDGDAVAFATDSGIVVTEDRDPRSPWFTPVPGHPIAVAFTPSGHRIYAGLKDRNELALLDRYTHKAERPIALPGAAGAVRMDPWGRVVLVRPTGEPGTTDEVWVVSIASDQVIGRVAAGWASDLPIVSEEGVLLVRQGRAVVARDVRTLDSLGAAPDGAADLWFVGRWKPASPVAAAIQEARALPAAPPAGPAPRAVAVAPSTPNPTRTPSTAPPPAVQPAAPVSPAPAARAAPARAPEPPRIWIQVSVSQNERWARDLAAELSRSGHHAQVIEPPAPGAGWRVVVGPYATRVAADSAARTLGRPYWIVERGADSADRP